MSGRSAAKLSKPSARERGTEATSTRAPLQRTLVGDVALMLAAIERFRGFEDSPLLTRAAVEFARDSLGLERVGLYLVQRTKPQVVMRGTWGTDDRGGTTDERGIVHGATRDGLEMLLALHERGELWVHRTFEPRATDRRCLPWTREDREWLAITPLIAGGSVVGVFYNDTAISNAPVDTTKQAQLAMFGGLLAELVRERVSRQPVAKLAELARDGLAPPHPLDDESPPASMVSRFIHKVIAELELDPQLSGEELARRFRVSPGHLARTFKAEVGTSLVDYRNRIRLERFFTVMRPGQSNLNEAALEAGFGSYAQFIRVHRQLTGLAPSEFSESLR